MLFCRQREIHRSLPESFSKKVLVDHIATRLGHARMRPTQRENGRQISLYFVARARVQHIDLMQVGVLPYTAEETANEMPYLLPESRRELLHELDMLMGTDAPLSAVLLSIPVSPHFNLALSNT
jgi:hypothetical protein